MADLVNLNKARKAKARTQAALQAAQNRVSHGRTKAEKDRAKQEAERARDALDGARRDRPES